MSDPHRGDIIVFESEASGKRLVKRVVGIPGDRVELINNILYINNQRLRYRDMHSVGTVTDRLESMSGTEHVIRIDNNGSQLSNFPAVDVPNGHYLALGDNRDNSADSRVIGFVPRDEIIGRSKRVVLSFNYENNYIPRSNRFFHTL